MRLLLYNIRYATGTGAAFHLPVPARVTCAAIHACSTASPGSSRPPTRTSSGLVEVDTGSIRTGGVNQAEVIAESLGHYSTYQCKYGTASFNTLVPIVNKQANAFLAAPRVEGERFHYFDTGIKRLIIELELDDLCVFLVHLSLKFPPPPCAAAPPVRAREALAQARDRRRRLQHLLGEHEMALFMEAAGLKSANRDRLPSYPAKKPRMELDFILHTRGIEISSFDVPAITFSDHRPLICDFRLTGEQLAAA